MNHIEPAVVYQLRIYVKGISPMVWRRILVRGDTTIADLHEIMQILMSWYDVHLHHFLIRGKRYGIGRIGTMGFTDNPYKITLDHFQFRIQIVVEHNDKEPTQIIEEVGCLSQGALLPATLGLSLAEGKELLAAIQKQLAINCGVAKTQSNL